MKRELLRAKFLGSMVGAAVGDGLGASFEGWWGGEAAEVRAVTDRARLLRYTDDTHMMIGIAESLVERKGFDGEHMAWAFIRNYEREPWRGYGPGPPRIFRMIKGGEAWNKAAEKLYRGGSFGNGSAMRVAPVGLFCWDDPTKLREMAHQSSLITHSHELGKEGAALQAYAVALAAGLDPGAEFNGDGFLAKLEQFVAHEVYRQKVRKIDELLRVRDRARVVSGLGNGIEAFNSVPTAIYSFLAHPCSFAEAVLNAVSLGGDADSIGAMTGAISGAYVGVGGIPEEWKQKLENRAYIEGLAERLWEVRNEL